MPTKNSSLLALKSLPKAELHVHLDCSLSYDLVAMLQPSTTRSQYQHDFIAPPKCAGLAEFLQRTAASVALMQSEMALSLVVADLFKQLRKDNVVYAEIRFAPLLHTREHLSPEKVVETVEKATEEASKSTGVESGILLCTLRHFTEQESMETARLVERFRGTRIVGLDLAADEAGHPINAHVRAFKFAIEQGIPRTAHAGEARGPESVWETLRLLRPSRIGHGVRSIEDPVLVRYIKEHNIHLEICPSCNAQIGIYDSLSNHPIDRLYKAGISLGVNTDTRTITDTTLDREYENLHRVFGWNAKDFLQCNLYAVSAAFLPERKKNMIMHRLHDAYSLVTVSEDAA